jgi:phosphoglycerol transferase MdoB-like AlkP superfamily enzyme
VADEDAFGIAIDECDESFKAGKPFFNHIMTVSNHRPYTYPEGRIDIPPSRKSGMVLLKYTDYSINKFLKDASKNPGSTIPFL